MTDRADEIAREIVDRAVRDIDWDDIHAAIAAALRSYGDERLEAIDGSGTHWVAPWEATDPIIDGLLYCESSDEIRQGWVLARTAYLAEQPDKDTGT